MKKLLKVAAFAAVAFGLLFASTASSEAACVIVRTHRPVVVSREVVVTPAPIVATNVVRVIHPAPIGWHFVRR